MAIGRKIKAKFKKDDLIKMVVEWVMDGIAQAEIKSKFTQLDYSIAYFYVIYKQAKVLIDEAIKGIAENRLESTIIVMEEQYLQAIKEGDRKLGNEIRKEINKISGLHITKTDITTNGQSMSNISIIKLIEIKND